MKEIYKRRKNPKSFRKTKKNNKNNKKRRSLGRTKKFKSSKKSYKMIRHRRQTGGRSAKFYDIVNEVESSSIERVLENDKYKLGDILLIGDNEFAIVDEDSHGRRSYTIGDAEIAFDHRILPKLKEQGIVYEEMLRNDSDSGDYYLRSDLEEMIQAYKDAGIYTITHYT
jgi:hypothetical protein